MFINDFDLKIHLYGDEDNFGLLTIDDGRLNGEKEHDNMIYNKLPQGSYPINHVTSKKIGQAIANYVESYLVYVDESDYRDELVHFEADSIKEIERLLNFSIHFSLYCKERKGNKLVFPKEKQYVEISFVRVLTFESFFLKFNDSLTNEEIVKIMLYFSYVIYGRNNDELTKPAVKSLNSMSKLYLLDLERKNYVNHDTVINALKNSNINGIDDNSWNDIKFDNFADFIIDCYKRNEFFNCFKYSSHVFFANADFVALIISRLDYYLITTTQEELYPKIFYNNPRSYYYIHARKKANENDYKFRYGVMKK